MRAESNRRTVEAEKGERAEWSVSSRTLRRVDAPPLVPSLSGPPMRWQLRGLVLSLLTVAAVAFATGASISVPLALIVLALFSLIVLVRAQREQMRLNSLLDEKSALSRQEIEFLSGRMWKFRQSEEHIHGLLDALGDIVVHRDAKGRITYANRVMGDLMAQDDQALIGRTLSELGVEIGLVPESAFVDGECLSATDVSIPVAGERRWFSWTEL
jgi:PAS domain-containing protein